MRKILLLSYFYPPCNLTAAQRVQAFSEYLSKHELYPIVVTRNWDVPIQDEKDLALPAGEEEIVEKNEDFEIHYLPFRGSPRDQVLAKYGENSKTLLRKFLTFLELIFQNFGKLTDDQRRLGKKVEEIIAKEGIDLLLISANPFWQYYLGYKLKKKYPNLKWIADYRDDWTTGSLGRSRGALQKFIHWIEAGNEKKWLKNCSLVVSVTDVLSNRIGKYVGVKSVTVANGFMDIDEFEKKEVCPKNSFTISYTGYLYREQQVEVFLRALKRIIDRFGDKVSVKVRFIGTAFDRNSAHRVLDLMKGYEENVMLTKRISRTETIEMESESDVLLMLAYKDFKGIPGSKLYQYLAHKKPILLCPPDGDIVEEILKETGLGVVCADEDETFGSLNRLIEKKLKSEKLIDSERIQNIDRYSRRNQVEILANHLKGL